MLKYITAGHTFMSADNLASLSNIKSAKQTLKEERVQDIFEKDTSHSLFLKEFDEHLKLMKGHFKPAEEKKKKDAVKTSSASFTRGQGRGFQAPQQPFRGPPSSNSLPIMSKKLSYLSSIPYFRVSYIPHPGQSTFYVPFTKVAQLMTLATTEVWQLDRQSQNFTA